MPATRSVLHSEFLDPRTLAKLLHVRFRNVRGTLPDKGSSTEVFLDDGDLDMARLMQALEEADYDGVNLAR